MKGYSNNLDILRSIAVLAVLVDHFLFYICQVYTAGPVGMVQLGRSGVLIFFVHTCMVLLISLERQALAGGHQFAVFYIRRFFRIYPLSVCCVLITIGLAIPATPDGELAKVGMDVAGANILLIQNVFGMPSILGPLWSLPFEVQMYIAIPFVYLYLKRFRSIAAAAGLWLASVLAYVVIHKLNPRAGDLLEFVPCFLAGALAYRIGAQRRPKLPSVLWPFAVLGVILFYAAVNGSLTRGRVALSEWSACALLGCIVHLFSEVKARPVVWVAKTIAKYSYGIYLFHLPILWFAFVHLASKPAAVRWTVFTGLILCTPVAFYHALEGPAIAFGNRLARSRVRDLSDHSRKESPNTPGRAFRPFRDPIRIGNEE